MYSVEDLLISHGYKLPSSSSSAAPTPTPDASSSRLQAPSPPPPSSYHGKRLDVLEIRPGISHGTTVNGYERDVVGGLVGSYGTNGGGGSSRPPTGCRVAFSNNNEPCRDRDRDRDRGEGGRQEVDGRNQGDTHSLGESLTSDSGFCDGPRGPQQHPQSKDVAYWRRRGQDFTVLLDYADFREPPGGGGGGGGGGGQQGEYILRQPGPQQPRGQEMPAEERQARAAHQERQQRWAAQAHVQAQAQAQARSREREAALHQWRVAAERKCQSLGTEEWRPAVSFGRQLSESEGEVRWALQEQQQRLHGGARTPEGMVAVHPARTKAKSQSLPRMLMQPDSLQYVDIATGPGPELYRRVNGGHPLVSPHDIYNRVVPRWPENNGRPASATQLSVTPKQPRFTRPPRPPSYEVHQQIRGSCEVLSGSGGSGRDSAGIPQARDRTPLPLSRPCDPQLDYFSADSSGPPGYIPPPSYKRAPVMPGGHRGYGEIPVNYRYRGDVYQQIHMVPDGSHWYARYPAGLWADPPQRERSVQLPSRKQLYPGYAVQERPGGGVQYIPFDDPRVRHISSALGGNSLTDADKIRHIRNNELPSVTVSEPHVCSDDSAFLPPPLGPFVAARQAAETAHHKTSSSTCDFDNDNDRWHSDLHKETVDNFPAATDQNCNRYSKNQVPPPSPSPSPMSAFQATVVACSSSTSRQGHNSDQGFTETMITQVKKIVPQDSGSESSSRNSKRRVSETIFCLVSVPIHSATNISIKDSAADQNNNEMIPSLTVTNTDSVVTLGGHAADNQKLRSRSMADMPLRPNHHSHFHTSSSTSSMRNYKRAPLRKEIIDAWALQANEDKELCYAGSWPGNQYRNQETQTSSPLTVKSPGPQSPPRVLQEAGQSAPPETTTTDSALSPSDSSSASYGCPMAGQKNLHPSSNSAFCRLSLVVSAQPSSPPPPSQSTPSSPSREASEQVDQQPPSSPRKSGSSNPADGEEQVAAFGQFLLKPVNRRPWDAIGELEYFNKEFDDTIAKRSNVEKCIEELEEVHENILELSRSAAHTITATPDPGRQALSLPPMHIHNPRSVKTRSESWSSSSTDPDYREVRSAFSRPNQERTRPATAELSAPPEHSPRQHASSLDQPTQNADPNHVVYRQEDIPVPQESLLRDVGLTVYSETPESPGGTIQRSLLSPLGPQELSPSVELSWESRTACVTDGAGVENSSPDLQELQVEAQPVAKVEGDDAEQVYRQDIPRHPSPPRFMRPVPNLMIRRYHSENSKPTSSHKHIGRLSREAALSFEDDSLDERFVFPERLTYRNDSTMADRHLESLLIREKANSLPAEDLSTLYEVKCAKGIPENESIEQRAARILGIAVPVEALGRVADRQAEDNQDEPEDISITTTTDTTDITDLPTETHDSEEDRETQQVARECEQVNEESLNDRGQESEEEEDTGTMCIVPACDVDHTKDEDRQTPGENDSDSEDGHSRESQQTVVQLDRIPEFPPSSLPLSLPVFSPNGKLALSATCSGETTKGRCGTASKLIESLQDKLNSSASSSSPTSSCRSSPERMARLRELDSVSRMRRLCSGDFGDREGDRDAEESGAQVEAEGRVESGAQGEAEGQVESGAQVEAEGRVESGAQVEAEGRVESGAQVEAEGRVAEEKGDKQEGGGEEENDSGEEDVRKDDRERCDERTEEAEDEEEAHEVGQHREEEAEVEVELNIEEEELSGEIAISLENENDEAAMKMEESRIEVESELKIEEEEDEHNKPTGEDQIEENALDVVREHVSKEAERGELLPRPKQRNRAQKPPLLPKPRSVPKREITLPLSFSSVTCGSSSLEDEEVLSVSDSYDPSRVERV